MDAVIVDPSFQTEDRFVKSVIGKIDGMKDGNNMNFDKKTLSRRETLAFGGALIGVSACSQVPFSVASANASDKTRLNPKFKDPVWNRDTYARIAGDLDFSKEKIGWYKGKAIGVVPGMKNIEICGFQGFSGVFSRKAFAAGRRKLPQSFA